jgi:flagellar hook-length control protein FliK
VPADGGKKTPELGDWDAKVMRMLLKIDKTESENTQAAIQNEKLDLPKVATALFAKKPGQMRSALADGLDAALQAAFGTKGPAGATGMVDPAKSMAMPKTVEESIMTQLSGRVTEAIKSGVNEIRLLLRPESLGEMRVKLTLDGEVVMGKIYVENQQVKHIVEANLQTLRDSLGQHGLQTGSFDVDVGGHAREHLDDSSGSVASRDARNNGEVSDGAEKMESDRSAVIGGETGRRFGSNTIEYFA